jgi:hypothetical protein
VPSCMLGNPRPHLVTKVGEKLQPGGLGLLHLPPCSPDSAPIEQAWSKPNTPLRTIVARKVRALESARAETLDCIAAGDALGWFQRCGYLLWTRPGAAPRTITPLHQFPLFSEMGQASPPVSTGHKWLWH